MPPRFATVAGGKAISMDELAQTTEPGSDWGVACRFAAEGLTAQRPPVD
jgi:hypothetical protein